MWRSGGWGNLSRVTELSINSTETPCFLLHHERGHVLLSSSSLTPVESHKSHLQEESQPFWLPYLQSLQDIDEAILLYLVAFKIYRHPWACSDRKNNLVVTTTAKESNYYLGRSVSPVVKTKLYFITRLHQPRWMKFAKHIIILQDAAILQLSLNKVM